ncbi:MAG: hypothetical protein AB4911_18290, partial [Oscillochloridaceae bacterium umkhey_bin13]
MRDPRVAVDLELSLRPAGAGYLADARLTNPESAAPVMLATAAPLALDLQALLGLTNDLTAYGQLLTAQCFPAG